MLYSCTHVAPLGVKGLMHRSSTHDHLWSPTSWEVNDQRLYWGNHHMGHSAQPRWYTYRPRCLLQLEI